MIKVALLLLLALPAYGADPRYCGPPARDPVTGRILRSDVIKRDYRREVPCPVNPDLYGACSGWALDHVWPLYRCGCDSVGNIQWLRNDAKKIKDSFEMSVYKCKPEDSPLKADRQ